MKESFDELTHYKDKKTGKIEYKYMDMEGFKYIAKTREYLNYLEEHLNFVHKAFCELNIACDGMWWVSDDSEWFDIAYDVRLHDISKFNKNEFTQYRANFFPVSDSDKNHSNFDDAWEHHKKHNHHHHETAKTYGDIVHMVVDWMAMAYKFNGCPLEFYEKNKSKMNLSEDNTKYLIEILDKVKKHREIN